LFSLVFLLVLETNSSAAPTTEGFALNRFSPAEPGSSWFEVDSLDLRGSARPALALMGDFSYQPLMILDGSGEELVAVVDRQFFYHLSAALVVARRLRLSASLPLLVYSQGGAGRLAELGGAQNVLIASPDGSGLGDLRLGTDLRLFGEHAGPFTLAVGARVFLGVGSEDHFASDGQVRGEGRLMWAGRHGVFTHAARVGVLLHGERGDFAAVPFGTDLTFGAGIGLWLADGRVTLGPELYGSTVVSDSGEGFLERASTPLEALLGAKFHVGSAVRLGVAAGSGVTQGLGSPQYRLLASLEWQPRAETEAAAPEAVREPAALVAPADVDADRVMDDRDACPREAGVPSRDPALHGCPLSDKDADGIVDGVDACPRVKGVAHATRELHGCPKDSDGDGVEDAVDRCPLQAGLGSDDPELNGCPIARIEQGEIKINQRIEFESSRASLVAESFAVLSAVASILSENPDIEQLSVEGHTDSRGPAAFNLGLSQKRAAAVVEWLISHGVEAERLSSRGFGLERPIDSNATEAGRRNNRRVEFRIVRRKGGGRRD
jgi:OOP family OmpA-OmpF porin